MYGYIYKTTNLINDKIYIGQKKAENFLSTYFGSGRLIRKALKKYGKKNFKVDLIVWCETKKDLDYQERFWIQEFNSRNHDIGYNLAEGGEGSNGGGFKGKHHSTQIRQQISKSVSKANEYRKGKKMTDIVGPNYINGMKGKPAANKGKIKIYSKEFDKALYVDKSEISNYSGYIIGNGKDQDRKIDQSYLNNPYYKEQLKKRFLNTKFIHNDFLNRCKRVKEEDLNTYLLNGWTIGRKFYK